MSMWSLGWRHSCYEQGWQPVLATKANVASYQVVSSLEGSSRLEGANAV